MDVVGDVDVGAQPARMIGFMGRFWLILCLLCLCVYGLDGSIMFRFPNGSKLYASSSHLLEDLSLPATLVDSPAYKITLSLKK